MPGDLRAVIFDVDGVLIDSLIKHLEFCKDEASALGLIIDVPDTDLFRRMVLSGTKVSPMEDFFRAVGFPKDKIARAVKDYDANFSKTHTPSTFHGVSSTLRMLHGSGVKLGLVTSNVRENVEPVLGDLINLFEPLCKYYLEPGQTKATQIARGAHALGIDVADCVFVGDQPADEIAAKTAGSKFVGVTYGWGFRSGGAQTFEIAESVYAIPLAAQRVVLSGSEALQFDYAWKWFNFHADQRVKMFNYMFVGLGLFATAIVGTLDKHLNTLVPVSLCALAALLALIFSRIDTRNQALLRLSEEVLTELERTAIFGSENWIVDRAGSRIHFGILWRQYLEDHRPNGFVKVVSDAWQGRHRIWLRAIAILLAALFATSSLLIWKYGLPNQEGKEKPKLYLLGGPG